MVRSSERIPDTETISRDHLIYEGALIAFPTLVVVIIITRILSRLNLRVLDSNMGIFVIAVFVSESIFLVATGSDPLPFIRNFMMDDASGANLRGALELYIVLIAFSIIGTVLDWIIVEKLFSFFAGKILKQSTT